MNKTAKAFSFVLIACIMLVGFVACGSEISKIYLKAGSMDTTIVVGTQLDTSNAVIVVEYEDGSKSEIKAKEDSEVKFSQVDTSEIGIQELTITYKEKTYKVDIKIVNEGEEKYTILGVEKPLFITNHEANKAEKKDNPNTEEDETEYSFLVNDSAYKVGDDNPFVLYPNITAENSEGEDVTLTSGIAIDVKVSMKNKEGIFEDVTNNSTYIEDIDYDKSSVDFTSEAIGKTFKMEVFPLSWAYPEDAVTLEFEVVDGWNGYNVYDLSRLNNIPDEYNPATAAIKQGWIDYKEEHNIVNGKINGFILHNNITITDADLPEALFMQDGSLKNRISIYALHTNEGETFSFYGNYFNIDASQITKTVVSGTEGETSHSALLGFGGDNHNSSSVKQGNTYIENISFRGNSKKSEDADMAGGMFLTNQSQQNLTINNIISTAFQTQIVATHNKENYNNTIHINKSKMYDCYSTMLYLWAVKNTYINDCILKRAGGPLIMSVHVNPEHAGNEEHYSNVTVQNSVVENWVEGKEAWFGNYEGTTALVGRIKAMSALFEGTSDALMGADLITKGKTFVDKTKGVADGLVNFMGIVMADDPLQTVAPVNGTIVFKNAEGEVVNTLNCAEETLRANVSVTGTLLPYFQSSTQSNADGIKQYVTVLPTNDGLGKLTEKGIVEFAQNSTKEEKESFFSGDYLNLYANGAGLGVMIQYLDYPTEA